MKTELKGLTEDDNNILHDVLLRRFHLSDEDTASKLHALNDIIDSINKIYNEVIPKILIEKDFDTIQDLYWDIREEFRHVDYHIHDANLIEE